MQEARRYVRTVIFDGECGFCLRAIRIGRRLDWWRRIDWRARLEPGVNERFPQLSQEETQRRMVSIRTDGRICGGFDAVRDILLQLPLTMLPALVLYLPGMSVVGVPLYRWIATNRYRVGGTREEACSVKAKAISAEHGGCCTGTGGVAAPGSFLRTSFFDHYDRMSWGRSS
ncbi:MAG: DUF393 domain-containing protein, partial [Candidatus Omnitrophota bacterium]|nr:DUF393 domain-containing protein [Candidatus Omnitrophota bacterium]